jgi:glycosyltransferase involved in cell wall biosynthesis
MPWGSDILVQPDRYKIIKMIARKVMNQSDFIHCDAEAVKRKIINDYGIDGNRIIVFPRGIDLRLFKSHDRYECRRKLRLDDESFIVIFNRHLTPIYGIEDLLEGFRLFGKDKKDVLMLMLSEGPLKHTVIKFIRENRLQSKILLKDNVPNTEVPIFLNAADVYISTSLSDGSSLSLLEALTSGAGIVVTDVPALLDWTCFNNALIVRRKNPEDISKALENYYNNRDLIVRHAKINRQIAAENADWDRNYLKLKEIYGKMLNV